MHSVALPDAPPPPLAALQPSTAAEATGAVGSSPNVRDGVSQNGLR